MTNERAMGRTSVLIILAAVAALAASDGLAQCFAPSEVGELAVSKSGTDAVIQWTPPGDASASELVRGDLRTGRVNVIGIGQSCLGNDLGTAYTEAVNPPAHFGYWYLVRAANECGKGSWGASSEAGQTVERVTECGCSPDFARPDRYIGNPYTISDRRTCLEWERKDGNTGNPLHSYVAVSNYYSLNLNNPTPGWVSQVNTERFAGHSDWRLPKSAGPLSHPTGELPELETLLLVPCPGVQYQDYSQCIDPVFGPFPPDAGPGCNPEYCDVREPQYWSGSNVTGSPAYAWTINFVDGSWSDVSSKRFGLWYFRAVRGSLYGE